VPNLVFVIRYSVTIRDLSVLFPGVGPREEVQRRARAEFGGIEAKKEECRESRGRTHNNPPSAVARPWARKFLEFSFSYRCPNRFPVDRPASRSDDSRNCNLWSSIWTSPVASPLAGCPADRPYRSEA
jgi:hypothetical protein